MITSVEMMNFLSHSDTKLEFDGGVTVFVGHNGAGKSGIIDAITFALFGQHARKSNKGLIKRGSTQGFSRVSFSVNGRQYLAERKVDSKGGLAAQLSEKKPEGWVQIAAGERRQFGESMTEQIEKTVGLSFAKIKIASIVQQGELNSIIRAKPKEFKELLNAIIGIDRLDVASESMKTACREFRRGIQERWGYDDTHIEILRRDLEKTQRDLEESEPLRQVLSEKRRSAAEELAGMRRRMEAEAPKSEKIRQLEARRLELADYAKDVILGLRREIAEKERKIRDCEGCFDILAGGEGLESKARMAEEAIDRSQSRSQELASHGASLKEKLALAAKLQLKDGRCPVCDSRVDRLNPLFQEEHLRDEISRIYNEAAASERELQEYRKKRTGFLDRLQRSRDAEATLRAHSICTREELVKIQTEVKAKKEAIPVTSSTDLAEISQIDSHAKAIFESIAKLERETEGFSEQEFIGLKESAEEKQGEISGIDQEMGAIVQKIGNSEAQIKKITGMISELEIVRRYAAELDLVQASIFNRDGAVATSLRSWALDTVSAKTSEYLALLNTKIQRIQMSEKSRDVSIACFSKTEKLDLESLSGGEQVSVALALRLGMASLLGASGLNLMILDEPTAHLDAERRKALVGVLSNLSDISDSANPMQFIIISHDSEIFEDSSVERIYRFESVQDGTVVGAL